MPCMRSCGNEKVRPKNISDTFHTNYVGFVAITHPSFTRRRHISNYLSVEEIKLKGNKPVPRHAHAAVYHASLDVSVTYYSNIHHIYLYYSYRPCILLVVLTRTGSS
jgi:hypothetical protein